MQFKKIWMVVLAAGLALEGLWYLDVISFDNAFELIGVVNIAAAVFLVLDK